MLQIFRAAQLWIDSRRAWQDRSVPPPIAELVQAKPSGFALANRQRLPGCISRAGQRTDAAANAGGHGYPLFSSVFGRFSDLRNRKFFGSGKGLDITAGRGTCI